MFDFSNKFRACQKRVLVTSVDQDELLLNAAILKFVFLIESLSLYFLYMVDALKFRTLYSSDSQVNGCFSGLEFVNCLSE